MTKQVASGSVVHYRKDKIKLSVNKNEGSIEIGSKVSIEVEKDLFTQTKQLERKAEQTIIITLIKSKKIVEISLDGSPESITMDNIRKRNDEDLRLQEEMINNMMRDRKYKSID